MMKDLEEKQEKRKLGGRKFVAGFFLFMAGIFLLAAGLWRMFA